MCGEALPWLVDADQTTFKAAVEESPLPVLVEFWATWCAPCRIVAPALEQLSPEMAGRLKVVKVDSDASPQLSERFSVRGIPTLMLFDGGEVRARMTGAMGTPQLRQWLLANLKSRQRA